MPLPSPLYINIDGWEHLSETQLMDRLESLTADIIVIDAPGAHTPLSERFHACADLIVTPLNDSLVDLTVLAEVDPESGSVIRPSRYAQRVWKARQARGHVMGVRFNGLSSVNGSVRWMPTTSGSWPIF